MNTTAEKNDLVINVTGLSKTFGEKKVVNNLAMQVKRGEIFGFLGPNGSGKTTTIRMLCGLLTPDSGEGTCLGFDFRTERDAIKREVGYMTQRFSLYEDLTVKENLTFIGRLYQIADRTEKIESIMTLMNLKSREKQLAGQLSGGWKQRLALACALLHEPKLLLLDEPTAGVDPSARRAFWDYIHLLSQQGITTLVSTHYMDEAERCHRISYIAYGELLATGTISEVLQQTKLFTYSIRGGDMSKLSLELRQTHPDLQIVAFGESMHISSKNKSRLEQTVQELMQRKYSAQMIEENLEDVFIYLVDITEKEALI